MNKAGVRVPAPWFSYQQQHKQQQQQQQQQNGKSSSSSSSEGDMNERRALSLEATLKLRLSEVTAHVETAASMPHLKRLLAMQVGCYWLFC